MFFGDRNFDYAIERLLDLEGEISDHPEDPGGVTKFGICSLWNPDVDVANLTRDQAVKIYYLRYWVRFRYMEIFSDKTAAYLFIQTVNIGPRKSHRLLQHAVNICVTGPHEENLETMEAAAVRDIGKTVIAHPLIADGLIGPKTIAALNAYPAPELILQQLKLLTIRYYCNYSKDVFLRGLIKMRVLGQITIDTRGGAK